jgi:hypothetical protein
MLKFHFKSKDGKSRLVVNPKTNKIEMWNQKPMESPKGFLFYIDYKYEKSEV